VREQAGDEPVEVARYASFDAPIRADLAVGLLQEIGIPAVRFPGHAGMIYDGALSGAQPVRVMVAAPHAEAARELLGRVADEWREAAEDLTQRPQEASCGGDAGGADEAPAGAPARSGKPMPPGVGVAAWVLGGLAALAAVIALSVLVVAMANAGTLGRTWADAASWAGGVAVLVVILWRALARRARGK
jgi:hypothetical protein